MGMLLEYFKSQMRRRIRPGKGIVALNGNCERLEVDNWAVSEFVVYDLVPIVGVHPYPLSELCLMTAAIAALNPSHIFEWGTNLGKSARVFYEAARRFDVSCQIISVDLPDEIEHVEHPHEKRGMFVKGLENIDLLLGDGLETSLARCRERNGGERFVPLFFIDGDHSYESVRRELSAIVNEVPEAHILLHDTFYQSEESGYNVGPFRAIEDVLVETGATYRRISQDTGLPGMTLLYRK